jgi:hypothetical protein
MLGLGVHPWDLELFTPDEETALHRYGETLKEG